MKIERKLHPITNQNLVLVLRRFSTKELKNFSYFLDSPLHNTHPSVCDLFQLLKPFYPKFKIRPDDVEVIYQQLYPKAEKVMENAKVASRFRALSSRLLSRMKGFLAFQAYNKNETVKNQQLLTALAQKDLGKLFNKTLHQTEQQHLYEEIEQADTYLHLACLEQQRFHYPAFLDQTKFKSLLPIVEKSAEYLDLYYALSRLKLRVEQLNSNKIFSKASPIEPIANIIKPVQPLAGFQSLLFQFYIELNQLLEKEGNEVLYHAFFEKLKQNYHQIDIVEQRTIYHKLTNYCIRSNKLNAIFTTHLFNLYKFGIEHKYVFFNQHIEYLTFNNIVITACLLKEFEWTQDFITNYHQNISPTKIQNDVTRLSWAFWDMYQRNYQSVVDRLSTQFDETNIALSLLARSVRIRALYEIWQQHTIFSELSSEAVELRQQTYYFSKYMTGKTAFSPHLRTPYSNLIYFIQKLISLKLQEVQFRTSPNIDLILEELETKKTVAKRWLKEKAGQLGIVVENKIA